MRYIYIAKDIDMSKNPTQIAMYIYISIYIYNIDIKCYNDILYTKNQRMIVGNGLVSGIPCIYF